MAISGYNITMKKKRCEAFKIDSDLMQIIRQFARRDSRSIKTTIEIVLRERFTTGKVFEAK